MVTTWGLVSLFENTLFTHNFHAQLSEALFVMEANSFLIHAIYFEVIYVGQ